MPAGTAGDIGLVNAAITRLLGAATGGAPPHVFTTLARHRSLFRKWLLFASGLMPGGELPRADTELVILRVAHNTGCCYEWHHHERLARAAGLTAAQLSDVQQAPQGGHWSDGADSCCGRPTSCTPTARSRTRCGSSCARR